jgi:hypothetical protein
MAWEFINGAYVAIVETALPKPLEEQPLVNAMTVKGVPVDNTDIDDDKVLVYDSATNSLVYERIRLSGDLNMSGSVITNIGLTNADEPTVNSACNFYYNENLEKIYFVVKDSDGNVINFSLDTQEQTLNQKLANHQFPKLCNQILQSPKQTNKIWNDLYLMDLAVIDASIAYTNPDFITHIRRQNPNIVILSYITFADLAPNASSTGQPFIYYFYNNMNSGWWLKDVAGGIVKLYPLGGSVYTQMMNHTISAFQDFFADTVKTKAIDIGFFDGVYYDNVMPTITWLDTRSPMPPAPGDQGIDINNDSVQDTGSALNDAWVAGSKATLAKADFGFRIRYKRIAG